jgi:acetoin:2,6-dichlorophenolindophenol oxidoreductase subunit beta
MGKRTLAETIKEISRKHLEENNGVLLGQCVSAVGWVNGTVPNCKGIIELPMTEQAGAGFATGLAMVGRRPIFVIRFQDFMMLNGSPFINYAAKSKDLHGKASPVFIRALASEGIGPVHSGVLHSMFMHFPGFRICSPMTPGEYETIWKDFMDHDDPMYVSEHRDSFKTTEEMSDLVHDKADITLFGISAPRLHMQEAVDLLAKDGIKCNVVHLLWLKPFFVTDIMKKSLAFSKSGLVVDASFEVCGASRSIAYDLEEATGVRVRALGLHDKTKCLCPPLQNRYPDAGRICEVVRSIVRKD